MCATLVGGDGRRGITAILASVWVRGCDAAMAIRVMGAEQTVLIILRNCLFCFFNTLRTRATGRFPARKDTDGLVTADDPPSAPMRWPNLHCGVKWRRGLR